MIVPTPPRLAGGVNSSMSWFVFECGIRMPDSSSPLTIGIWPFGIRTPVGYQRPWAILGCSRQVSVHGLKVNTRSRPFQVCDWDS